MLGFLMFPFLFFFLFLRFFVLSLFVLVFVFVLSLQCLQQQFLVLLTEFINEPLLSHCHGVNRLLFIWNGFCRAIIG